MNFKEYQNKSKIFDIYPEGKLKMYAHVLGLCGESGEIAEKLKKNIRDSVLDRKSIKKELGDVLWYLSQIATEFNLTLEEIAIENINKLTSRQERDKIAGSGDDR